MNVWFWLSLLPLLPLSLSKRVVTWPERCPQIGRSDSNIVMLVGSHSHQFSKNANMNACIYGNKPELCGGFVALESDYKTMWTWGAEGKGCTKKVSPTKVKKIVTTDSAFAVLSITGSVTMVWGNPEHGGAMPTPPPTGVVDIFANPYAFVALQADGGVVAWGDRKFGGFIPPERYALLTGGNYSVHTIVPSTFSFAALKSVNGSLLNSTVVPWGYAEYGGDLILQDCNPHELDATNILCSNTTVVGLGMGIQRLVSNGYAYLAFKAHGEIISFGFREYGGNCDKKFTRTSNNPDDAIDRIVPSFANFVAITKGGRAISCGYENWGWDNNGHAKDKVQKDVVDVVATDGAFAALMKDKTVVTWGKETGGGDSRQVKNRLKNIKKVVANMLSFVALKEDGTVVTWGNKFAGGDVESPVQRCYVRYRRSMNGNVLVHIWVRLMVVTIEEIYAGSEAFVAIRKDQGMITWGDSQYGAGLCMSYFTEKNQKEAEFKDWEKVVDVVASYTGFAALVEVDNTLKTVIESERRIALENAKKKVVKVVQTKGDRSAGVKPKPAMKWVAVGVMAAAAAAGAGGGIVMGGLAAGVA
eukprot:g5506.t1